MLPTTDPTKHHKLVFTDLDGTLLDHDTYSFEPAKRALEYLKTHHIPLLIVSSKTRPEIMQLQERLGINEPFIVENGAGIFIPPASSLRINGSDKWHTINLSKSYAEARAFIASLREPFNIRGFGDMTLDDVASLTGLDEASTRMAMQRDFTEPFILDDDSRIPELLKLARNAGFDIVKGGRFYHVITFHQDKANALAQLTHLYTGQYGEKPEVIALGDSENDFSMLQAADQPILIPKPDGSYADLTLPNLIRAPHPGPRGWQDALSSYLQVC